MKNGKTTPPPPNRPKFKKGYCRGRMDKFRAKAPSSQKRASGQGATRYIHGTMALTNQAPCCGRADTLYRAPRIFVCLTNSVLCIMITPPSLSRLSSFTLPSLTLRLSTATQG